MRWIFVVWLCACGSPQPAAGGARVSAAAAPAPPAAVAPPPEPAEAPICLEPDQLPGEAHVVAAVEGEALRVCLETEADAAHPQARACVALDLATGEPSKAGDGPVAPEPRLPAGTLEDRDGKPVACASDGTCRPLGRRLRRFLASRKDKDEPVGVSSDAAVMAGGAQLWSVRKDRRIKIAPPRDTHEYAPQVSYTIAGRFVIGQWTPCAADCQEYRVFAPDGRVVVDKIGSEGRPHVLDATRWGVLSNTLEVFDLATGKRRSKIAVFPAGKPATYAVDGVTYVWNEDPNFEISPEQYSTFVPLAPGRVAIVFRSEPVVAIVDLDQAKVESRIRIPICGDPDAERDAVLLNSGRP